MLLLAHAFTRFVLMQCRDIPSAQMPSTYLGSLSAAFDNLTPGAPIITLTKAPILFSKIERAKSKEEIKEEMRKAKRLKTRLKVGQRREAVN